MEEQKKNFWTKLKGFFTLEEKPEQEEPTQEQYSMPTPESTREQKECFYCKEWIKEGDRWSKQMNHWFHRPCYKKFLQAGRGGVL